MDVTQLILHRLQRWTSTHKSALRQDRTWTPPLVSKDASQDTTKEPAAKSRRTSSPSSIQRDNVITPTAQVTTGGEYAADAAGPFVVVLEGMPTTARPEPHLGRLHPLTVGRWLRDAGLAPVNFAPNSVNKLLVTFASAAEANSLLSSPLLQTHQCAASIPVRRSRCQGLIRRVDALATEAEFTTLARSSDDIPITAARRLDRHDPATGAWTPCGTWRLTFDAPRRPAKVFLFGVAFEVLPYISAVTQCSKCLVPPRRRVPWQGRVLQLHQSGSLLRHLPRYPPLLPPLPRSSPFHR